MPRAELVSRIRVSLASYHLISFQKRLQMLHDKKVYRNVKSKGIFNKDVAEALRWFIQKCSDRRPHNAKHWISPIKVTEHLPVISPIATAGVNFLIADLKSVLQAGLRMHWFNDRQTGEEKIAAMEICAVFTIWFDFSVARGERL